MALTPGTSLGVYEITAQIGTGGMGQVYQALDTTLGRRVAIKILPEAFAAEGERVARFEREAKTLASLNHPNIATIYSVEKSAGLHALVMELVDGDDLSQRIARGAIPIDEAVPIARQIADALDAAHGQGIIHRDLKPANIKVRADGTVKVLDFGLAKSLEPAGPAAASASQAPPTETTAALMTGAGMILGTAAYMAPEQARGQNADQRADIWAFGVVLWEMLTGRRLFAGETVSDTLAAVLRQEPAWDAVPQQVQGLLRLCLQKDPRRRIRDIGDARVLLKDAAVAPRSATTPGTVRPPSIWRRAMPVVASAAATALLVGGTMMVSWRQAPAAPVHLTVAHRAPEVVGGNDFDDNIAIAPDGRAVAYVAAVSSFNSNMLRLYLRALDRPEPALLSTSARTPFFSPDGRWVGFVENNERLSKVPVSGGPPVSIGGRVNAPRGISWGDDDTIVYATADLATGLMRIPAGGGEPAVLTKADGARGEADHVFPDVLPGGRGVLFTITNGREVDSSQVAILDAKAGTYRVLIQGGAHPRYVAPGYIVYGVTGSLRAVAFDLDRLEVIGTPTPVLEGVRTRASGSVAFGVASNGTLAYVERDAENAERTLVWIDRQGRETGLDLESGYYDSFALSRDGANVALNRRNAGGGSDIWVWSRERRALSRVTLEPGGSHEYPLWTPDGLSLVYSRCRSGCNLFRRRADGTGAAEPLLNQRDDLQRVQVLADGWTPDGRLLFEELRQGGNWDVKSVGVSGERAAEAPLLSDTTYREGAATVSPDGRWLAYVSNESLSAKVYARTFPDVNGGKWQLSTDYATTPRWSADGRVLYFLDSPGQSDPGVAVVTVNAGAAVPFSRPERLFNLPASVRGVGLARNFGGEFEVSADGQRFLFIRHGKPVAAPNLNVVLNWTEELKRRVSTR